MYIGILSRSEEVSPIDEAHAWVSASVLVQGVAECPRASLESSVRAGKGRAARQSDEQVVQREEAECEHGVPRLQVTLHATASNLSSGPGYKRLRRPAGASGRLAAREHMMG